MGPEKKFAPREEWPEWIREQLERVGITQHESVETIKPKIEQLGLAIRTMHVDHGGFLPTYPLYYAAVADPNDDESILGQYWSATDFAEALAWATAEVLNDRERRERQEQERLASTEPDEYVLPEFGPTCGAAPGLTADVLCPDDPEKSIAVILVDDEAVARISMPYAREIGRWNPEQEAKLRAAVRKLALTCDLKKRKGDVTLIFEPGTSGETKEPVHRPDAAPAPS